MAEERKVDILDYLVLLVKWRRFLIILFILVLGGAYALVYYGMDEQFDATAVIIPSESGSGMGLSSIMKDLPNIPFGLGSSSAEEEMDLYETYIYSRTTMEEMLEEFQLMQIWEMKSKEKSIKRLRRSIEAGSEDDVSFYITVRSLSPQRAADMANYLVKVINERIIEKNVQKSRDNRIFMEERKLEIENKLSAAEDSLRIYMNKTGVFEAEEQVKATIDAYTKLEAELAKQEVELAVYEQIFGENSTQANNLRVSVTKMKEKITSLKYGGGGDMLLSVNTMPQKALEYYRYFRDVEILTAMLEFVIPLYEQARFEEQKHVPVLQVVDSAVPPEKKSYPPRTAFSILIALFVIGIVTTILVVRELLRNSQNEKLQYIRRNWYRIFSSKDA